MSCACFHKQKAAEIVGYHSLTSGESPEKIYATPSEDDCEWYSESPQRKSLSPTWNKAFEKEMDALSSHSSDPEGPEDPGDPNGKTLRHGARNTIASKGSSGSSANARELKVFIQLHACSSSLHALMLYLQPSAQWRHARLLCRLRRPLHASGARDMPRA